MCKQRVSCRARLSLAPSEEQDLLAIDRASCLIGFDKGDLVRSTLSQTSHIPRIFPGQGVFPNWCFCLNGHPPKNKTNPADTHETCYAPLSKVACLNDLNDLNGSRLFFSFGFPEVP